MGVHEGLAAEVLDQVVRRQAESVGGGELLDLGPGTVADAVQLLAAEDHVLQNGEVVGELEMLEDHPDSALLRRDPRGVVAEDRDVALVRLRQQAEEELAKLGDLTAPALRQGLAAQEPRLEHRPRRVGKHADAQSASIAAVARNGAVEVVVSDDGEITFRLMECAGGCGRATVVVVDHRYREHVQADDVASILEELRAGG